MSRFEMTSHDLYRVEKAREELSALVDLSDDRAMARRVGRLEVALEQLLEMLDERGEDPASTAPRRQDPRYRDGTVVLQTLDHGEVTVPEPAFCVGHDDDLVGHLADVTHNGPAVRADAVTAEYGHLQVMEARVTHAPHGQVQPEPAPLLAIRVDVEATVAVEDGRHLTQALRAAAVRIDRALDEVARLRGEGR